MDFVLHCECGAPTRISEGSAGAKIDCTCGRTLSVPALHELRARAGLTAYITGSPEYMIERLLAAGRSPTDGSCAGCRAASAQTVRVKIECRQGIGRSRFKHPVLLIALVVLFALVVAVFWEKFLLMLVVFLLVFLFLSPLLFPILITLFWRFVLRSMQVPVEYGKNRVYWLPLPLCPNCERQAAGDRKVLRQFFWHVPLYRDLLEKYPSSRIDLSGMKGGL
jgi:hypothetical protein